MDATWKAGLEDVIAARSAICRVDGEAGRLYYRGYEIGDLAAGASFDDVTHLLWFGELPTASHQGEFSAGLEQARGRDPDVGSSEPDANLRKARRLMVLIPETVAAWQRIRMKREPVPSRRGGSHAAYFYYLLEGREPSPELARVLDVVLTLHADHEFNASTFAARVAVATLADLHAAIVSAIATLKGPRHGGANEDVLSMLLEIEDPARAEAFVESRLGARSGLSKHERANPKARMPGFGHRVYKVDDARARVLRGMAKSMAEATGRERLFEVAERLYDAMRARTTLPVNVDFFSAVVYDALGIPPDLCTSIFAVGRVAGWCAHALEQYADNRLIRPRADYTGLPPRSLDAARV